MAVKLSALRTGRSLPPGKIPGTHFCLWLCRPQGHSVPVPHPLSHIYIFFLILFCEAISTAATPGLLCQPRVIVKMIVEKQMECRLAGETEVLGGKPCPSATVVHHKIPHDRDPGLNPGRRGGKPATNRLSYGAALKWCIKYVLFIIIIWFVSLLALRPLLAYCASLGW
jgi:hypothetical protein